MKRKYIAFFVAFAALCLSGCWAEDYQMVQIGPESPSEAVLAAETFGGPEDMESGTAGQYTERETAGQYAEAEIVIGQEVPDGYGTVPEAPKDITLLFAGDVLLSDHVLQAYDRAGGIHGVLDEGYLQAAGQADFFMVNQEFPFSSRGTKAPNKQFTFRLEPGRAALFGQIGIDAVTLANNHALDYGQDALLDSCEVLDGAGILHTGAGRDLDEAKQAVVAEINGKKIAVIGATRVIPEAGWAAGNSHAGMLATYDPAVLLEEIRTLRRDNDYVVVYVHWGIERDEMPQEYQRSLGRQYIEAGADLVVGAHPHVLQGIEYYQGKPIVYSLGNFIFGSSIPRTALLEVTLKGVGEGEGGGSDADVKLRLVPGTSGAGYTHMLEDDVERQEFFRYMEGISLGVQVLEDGTVAEK